MDIVQRMYRNMKEQSVKSSPMRLRWEIPRIREKGSKGSLATTRPSNLEGQRDGELEREGGIPAHLRCSLRAGAGSW
jgi:hypothetical protein